MSPYCSWLLRCVKVSICSHNVLLVPSVRSCFMTLESITCSAKISWMLYNSLWLKCYCILFFLTNRGQRHTPPHISPNLKPAGNDFTWSDHAQAEPTMSLYGWPWSALVVCQQASRRSKDQRCASQTHYSPPVSLYSLQLVIPTSHASSTLSSFLSLHVRQTPPFIHYTEGRTLSGNCPLYCTLPNYIFECVCLCGTV